MGTHCQRLGALAINQCNRKSIDMEDICLGQVSARKPPAHRPPGPPVGQLNEPFDLRTFLVVFVN